jgi:glycerol-3-phosphate O-acyltransferase
LPGAGSQGYTGEQWLCLYAAILTNFLEGYRVTARALGALVKGPLSEKDLVKKALATGKRMFLAGEIQRLEAISKPILQNALHAFVDQGYIGNSDSKLLLAESFRTSKAVLAIEGRIAYYLGEGAA